MRHTGALLAATMSLGAAACTGTRAPGREAPAALPAGATDSTVTAAPRARSGLLRQEDIAVKLEGAGVQTRLIPLDEWVIRVLSPDSYHALRDLLASRREQIASLARAHALRDPSVWYVTFHGLAPESRFNPTDLTITSAGREFRPLEIVPLTTGFATQTVRARQTQAALILFEDGIDVTHPLTVSLGTQRSEQWAEILRRMGGRS